MKLIKTFESIKDLFNIEDLLLEFEDSGEIGGLIVDSLERENIKTFILIFKFNENLVGLDKLKVLDRIISRLKRKYHYIYIKDNCLYIDLIKLNKKYITGSLVVEVENILEEKLNNLNVYTSQRRSELKFYGKNIYDIIVQYHFSSKSLYADYTVFFLFQKLYKLDDKDIQSILKNKISKNLQIEVKSIGKVNMENLIMNVKDLKN